MISVFIITILASIAPQRVPVYMPSVSSACESAKDSILNSIWSGLDPGATDLCLIQFVQIGECAKCQLSMSMCADVLSKKLDGYSVLTIAALRCDRVRVFNAYRDKLASVDRVIMEDGRIANALQIPQFARAVVIDSKGKLLAIFTSQEEGEMCDVLARSLSVSLNMPEIDAPGS